MRSLVTLMWTSGNERLMYAQEGIGEEEWEVERIENYLKTKGSIDNKKNEDDTSSAHACSSLHTSV